MPKTEDKKNDDLNVNFKHEDGFPAVKENAAEIEEGKIIGSLETQEKNEKRVNPNIKRFFNCCYKRKIIKQVKMSSPVNDTETMY